MVQKRTIDSFFKRKQDVVHDNQPETVTQQGQTQQEPEPQPPPNEENLMQEPPVVQPETNIPNTTETNLDSLIRDPGARLSILSYPSDRRDEIRCAYIKLGPYQLTKSHYPHKPNGSRGHMRSFQEAWFKRFWWLEYSEKNDSAYCFPCSLFNKKPIGRFGSYTFTVKGFSNWKKVNSGKYCAFVTHEGNTSSAHNFSVRCYEDLKNQVCHIENVIERQTRQDIMENRLRLKVVIESLKWLTLQACALRGHDERPTSKNQGNFLELINYVASYNKDVAKVLENSPQNAKYTLPDIQKELLFIYALKVQKAIRNEIGKAKFCLIVDESQDESKKEQMVIVVRFVDQYGYVKERFLDLVHVKDTTALTLKNEILCSLSYHQLDVQDIRGQGYDGASNMRGEWNGLKALVLKECPYAYYIHCFAHQLQLALVGASKDVNEVHAFFKNLSFVVNVIGSSSKRNDQLQDAQIEEISHLTEIGELQGGKGANQIKSLQRPGDTRWSSHFKSVCSLIRLLGPTITVLKDIAIQGSTSFQRGDAKYALAHLLSFDFIIVLHIMKEIMEITDKLCQSLQRKTIDIVNAMNSVSITKLLIQDLRNERWQSILDEVVSFCEGNEISFPDMNATYKDIIRSRHKKDDVTVEHHYRVDVFIAAVDSQLQELNSRFSESVTELLRLSVSLDPRKSLNIDDICKLATKFYPLDFTEQERIQLKLELRHYELDLQNHPELKNACSLSELCKRLHETGTSENYELFDRLIRLVLTLPVSTATAERAFSAMKIVKTRLRTRMKNDFLKSCLILNIEREIANTITTDQIIDEFSKKGRRVRFKSNQKDTRP